MTDNCDSCLYKRTPPVQPGLDSSLLWCAYYAPSLTTSVNPQLGWPIVDPDYWCGQGVKGDGSGTAFAPAARGPAGPVGPGYTASSATSAATVNTGTVTFTDVPTTLAYSVGARIRATSRGTGEWMEGVLSSYSNAVFAFIADLCSGSGTHADWDINLAGEQGADGVAPSCTVVFTLLSTAPSGWLLFADQTIGDGSSGATYANAASVNVFTALFNNASDTNCPILDSGGGATTRGAQGTAAAAWAAHCRMTMPVSLGRALAVAGSGSGLTSRAFAKALGEETHTLSVPEVPSLGVSGSFSGSGDAALSSGNYGSSDAAIGVAVFGGSYPIAVGGSISGTTTGGGGSHNNMQPTTFLNAMVKL